MNYFLLAKLFEIIWNYFVRCWIQLPDQLDYPNNLIRTNHNIYEPNKYKMAAKINSFISSSALSIKPRCTIWTSFRQAVRCQASKRTNGSLIFLLFIPLDWGFWSLKWFRNDLCYFTEFKDQLDYVYVYSTLLLDLKVTI